MKLELKAVLTDARNITVHTECEDSPEAVLEAMAYLTQSILDYQRGASS